MNNHPNPIFFFTFGAGWRGMARGKFEGIIRDNVTEPHIKITGEYDTVYYGALSYFVLVVPKDAEVEQIPVSDISDIIIVVKDHKYCFKITYGDAMFPDKLTPIDCP
jgi:hypothetical protein